jgi:type I restriction enzyme S subunit
MGQSFIDDTELHVSADGAANGTRMVPKHTVLAVVRGMSLANEFRISITQREMTFNQDIKALHCVEGIDPHFLFYALKARKNHIRELATEASHGTKKLETDTLGAVEILVPETLEAQKAAASIALNYDDLIENNRRRIVLLEDAARQLYKEWFVRFRFPGHEHVRIINGVPEGWERLPLGDVLTLQRGFDLPTSDRNEGSVPVYGSTGIVGYHDTAKVQAPMLITGRSGSLGQVCLVSVPCWPLNTALWVREFKRASPWFSYFLLVDMGLEKFNGGASVPTLDRKVAHAAPVMLPTGPLMDQFDATARQGFELIDTLDRQNSELARARDLLLPKLMSGAIAV